MSQTVKDSEEATAALTITVKSATSVTPVYPFTVYVKEYVPGVRPSVVKIPVTELNAPEEVVSPNPPSALASGDSIVFRSTTEDDVLHTDNDESCPALGINGTVQICTELESICQLPFKLSRGFGSLEFSQQIF